MTTPTPRLPDDRRDEPAPATNDRPSHSVDPKQEDLGFALPEPAKISRAKLIAISTVVLATLAGAFLVRYLPNQRARASLESESHAGVIAIPRVDVVKPSQATSDQSIELPGTVNALEETIVYARANGYVRKWFVDFGSKVKEGDVLAEIETPEIDQEVAQARAQLAQADASLVQAKASAVFSKQNAARFENLTQQGLASQADLEKARSQADVDGANVTVAAANVQAQRANIDHLVQLKAFSKVQAPFSGTATSRTVERGQLVTAGVSPLYKITAMDPVRVFVQVPQDLAASVRIGGPAHVTLREFPGRTFEGLVWRSAGALDPQTRTMPVGVRVPNPIGELLPGMFAKVSIESLGPHRVFAVPATAVMNDAKGLRVAVVSDDDRIHWVPVLVDRDTGPMIEIGSGLDGSERVVKLPSVALSEGLQVEVAK